MICARTLVAALGCALIVLGCDRNPEAPTAPTASPPAASAATAAPAPEATGAPDTSAATKAAGWRPAKCAEYSFTPLDCKGSAENPDCRDSFEIHPDGKAVKTFGDIMTRGSYESSGHTVTIRVPDRSYSETFTVEDDGKVLVASKGGRYQRSDCP
jgi:hypothetical protein